MLKPLDKTKKLSERREKSLKPKESSRKKKLLTKPLLPKVKPLLKEPKKERNDSIFNTNIIKLNLFLFWSSYTISS
jgi:hypothetical protein